jgi:glycosyltransferase involved in cell wall biosynthesis
MQYNLATPYVPAVTRMDNTSETRSFRLRILICWTEFAGYTAACWRELASRADIDLRIIAWPSNLSRSGTQFDRALVGGLPVRFLEGAEQQDHDLVARLVAKHSPDVLMIGGWAEPPYRALANNSKIASARLVLAMDTPWKGTFRQRFARLKIGSFIDRLDGVFVPGQLGQRFARHLHMPEERIFAGMLGFDYRLFENVLDRRLTAPWPRSFVYLGRYSVEKALDVLVAGYARYRASVADAWPLACYGSGPMRHLLEVQTGVQVNDWVQPPDQPEVLARQGVSVLTSRSEAWGVAVAEAMASGLPAICSDRVGAVADLIHPEQNGLVIPANDPAALAAALRWMHDHFGRLPEMGRAAREAAAPYSAQRWADRFQAMARALRELPGRR